MPSEPASDASSGPVAARKALPTAATPSGHAEPSAPTEGAAGAMASRDLLGDAMPTSGNLVRRQLDVLALQRLTGNAAVAGLFSGRPAVQRQQAPAASPAAGGTTSGDRTKIDKALQSKEPDPGLVKDIDDFGPANKDERIKLARILVYHYSMFFGPRDRSCLTRIFTSFGDDLKYVADKDPFLLEKCLKEWPGLMFDLKSVKTAGDDFRKAIGAQARKNLEDNITYLKAERKRLFGVEGPSPEVVLEDSKRQGERAQAMILIAEKILKLRRKQKEMLDKVVGFKYQEHNPFAPTAPQTFKPGKPPQHKHDQEPTYDSLQESWDAAAMLTGLHATKYPWLFGLLKDPEAADARLQGLVDQKSNPTAARVQIMSEMQTQITRAEVVLNDYKIKEPDWYDLVPIREQLFEKALDKNFERLVARQVVGSRDDAEWWKKVGLESATFAALVVASFATAGAAPVVAGLIAGAVAVGIPAAEAYLAYEKAGKLQNANQATVLPGTDLVTEAQVDAAKAEALAKAIEVLLNAVLIGGEAAMAAKFEIQLARVGEYAADKQAQLIAQAVKKGYGPVGTSTRTGLSLSQLAAKVGPETEAGKLIQKEIAELAAKPVAELTVEQRGALRALGKDATAGAEGAAERTLSDPAVAAKLTGESQELIRTWTQLGTKDARLAWCKQRTVALLKDAGIDIEIAVVDEAMGAGSWGSFNPAEWRIKFNRAILADDKASATTINEMMKTILHESRHAEQYWLMARRLYGRGWKAAEIEEALGLRADLIGSARRAGPIADTDAAAKAIDFWLKDFDTKKARDFRKFFLDGKKEWKQKFDAAEAKYLDACKPENLQPLETRDRLLKSRQFASEQLKVFDNLYRTSGIEGDAFAVEKGVSVDLAKEAQAKAIYDSIVKKWTSLVESWELKLVDRETALELAKKAGKPGFTLKRLETEVSEAKQLLEQIKNAKPNVS